MDLLSTVTAPLLPISNESWVITEVVKDVCVEEAHCRQSPHHCILLPARIDVTRHPPSPAACCVQRQAGSALHPAGQAVRLRHPRAAAVRGRSSCVAALVLLRPSGTV
jgi:hypothetical protein